jgi:hypothetical protein
MLFSFPNACLSTENSEEPKSNEIKPNQTKDEFPSGLFDNALQIL